MPLLKIFDENATETCGVGKVAACGSKAVNFRYVDPRVARQGGTISAGRGRNLSH